MKMSLAGILASLGSKELLIALWETIEMTFVSTFFAYVIGLPLGVLLVVTAKDGIRPRPVFNTVLGTIVNFLRSIPFIILLALLIPVTRAVMGTAIQMKGILFPLIISAFPYVARMVESSLLEVDPNIIEAAESMGSTPWQIVRKVLLPEALPSLITGASITIVAIIGYTSMAHVVSGGGLGQMAIAKGYNTRKFDIMYAASIALVILVQLIAMLGSFLGRVSNHKSRKS